MYISSIIALAPGIITRGASICTAWVLRYLNLLFNTASLIIAVYIFKAWNEKEKDSNVRTKKNLLCNCDYILFTKLPWPGDSKGAFRSSSQAATCLPHTMEASHCSFNC